MAKHRLRNLYPGDVMPEEFPVPCSIGATALTRAISAVPRRVSEVALDKRSITAYTAVRRACARHERGMQDWAQADYDLERARSEPADQLPETERLAT